VAHELRLEWRSSSRRSLWVKIILEGPLPITKYLMWL
jgi:hypothetical protein